MVGDSKRLAVLPALSTSGARLVLPEVEFNDKWSTEIHVVNVSCHSLPVTMSLRAMDGSEVGTYSASLQPHGKLIHRMDEMFPDLSAPFTGYLLITASDNVAAAELLLSTVALAALPGTPLVAGSGTATKLYSAHLASGGALDTRG
jgi:hypothetical protein